MKPTVSFAQRLLSLLRPADDDSTDTTAVLATTPSTAYKLPGDLESRYQVQKILGRGAFGIVYLARDLRLGRLVAVKQLYKKHRLGSEAHGRFLQEARIAGQLDHPNIVTIYGVEEIADSACIIMEYLAGGNLADILRKRGPLSERLALTYVRSILFGLHAAHAMGVVHRDIKPRNILFDQYQTPKISDFGIARFPAERGGIDTTENRPAGTPEYMAPEQMVANEPIDARVDIFAVGVILFELLTGRRPFHMRGLRNFEQAHKLLMDLPLPVLSDLRPDASEHVAALLQRLLAKSPQRRFATAELALTAVEAALHQVQTSTPDPLPVTPERAAVRKDMFTDVLRLFLVDGINSPAMRRELAQRADRLGVSAAEARDAEERVRREMGMPALADLEVSVERVNRVARRYGIDSDRTESELVACARDYGLDPKEQAKIRHHVALALQMAP